MTNCVLPPHASPPCLLHLILILARAWERLVFDAFLNITVAVERLVAAEDPHLVGRRCAASRRDRL